MIVFGRPHLGSIASGARDLGRPTAPFIAATAPAKLSLPDNVLLYYGALLGFRVETLNCFCEGRSDGRASTVVM